MTTAFPRTREHRLPPEDRRLARFRTFNELGGKFRVAITGLCNLDCFFCHNEGMRNPRRGTAPPRSPDARPIADDALVEIVRTYIALGGRQVNITGGEPLTHPRFFELMDEIASIKGDARIVLNSNAVLARRLLSRPALPAIDGILASLHTTSPKLFRSLLHGNSVERLMRDIVDLSHHGYAVELNYSLGPYNCDSFGDVLDYCVEHELDLKAIALVRPHEADSFYRGDWVDPAWIERQLRERGGTWIDAKEALGGYRSRYRLGRSTVTVKNIARGRLHTTYCNGCAHRDRCGEGIYGLRVGVDGLWKPCLLRGEGFSPVSGDDYRDEILDHISAMVGAVERFEFASGPPS